MMCGIDQAIEIIKQCDFLYGVPNSELIINRLEYHRNQAEGMKPRYHADQVLKDYYTCRNCGHRVAINDNYCPNCGYAIKWDSCRCLTGLPLVDIAEKAMTGGQA